MLKNYQFQAYSFNMYHTQLDSRCTENTTEMLLISWNSYGFNYEFLEEYFICFLYESTFVVLRRIK